MNWLIEALGITAGMFILSATILKRLITIRVFLLVGILLFLTYGIINNLPAIIIVNAVGIGISICSLVDAIKNENNSGCVRSK